MAEKPICDPDAIANWHAHVYYDLGETKDRAERLRMNIATTFPDAQIGAWYDVLVGPHTKPMYEVAFSPELFGRFVRWLALYQDGLSILIHPNSTGDHIADHTLHAIWLGSRLPVNTTKWERQRAMAQAQGIEFFDHPV